MTGQTKAPSQGCAEHLVKALQDTKARLCKAKHCKVPRQSSAMLVGMAVQVT
jgi:hypothetical protein